MNSFEKWQVALGITQTGILLMTFLGALYIGFKQNEINQNLLDLNYSPSLEVTYSESRFNIYNKGKENIFLWGSRVNNGQALIEKEPRLITPGGFYYLLTDNLKIGIAAGTETTFPFELFFESAQKKRYVVKSIVFAKRPNQEIEIHTQTTGLMEFDWEK